MAIFNDVTLAWAGVEYTVKSNQVMRLIAVLEDHVTIQDLSRPQGPPMARVAMAFASALQFAGARNVIADDVYAALFDGETAQDTVNAVSALMMIMVPPSTYQPQVDPKPKARTQRKKPAPSKARIG